jgi:hypothetical protein
MTSLVEAAFEAGQPIDTLPTRKPHVMICTPCHSGKVDLNYHISLIMACDYLNKHGIDYTLDYNIGMAVDWARSTMATGFLKDTDCTHLLFIDDDMAFAPDLLFRLIMEQVDIVAVPYRRKIRDVKFNVRHGVRVRTMPARPYMVGVDSIATGMMLVRRNVFENLAKTTPEFRYDETGKSGWLFFRHQLVDDEMVGGISYMGEDYWFCKKAKEAGYEIWCYADEHIAHIGTYAFDGKYSDECEKGVKTRCSDDRPKLPMRLMTQ